MAWFAWESDAIDLKDRFQPKRFLEVEPGAIYRSGQLSRHLVAATLARHHIRVIIDLQEAVDSADQLAELEAARAAGIEHVRFPLAGDGTGNLNAFAGAIAAIARAHDAGQPVLVHCSAGTRRTGAVLAAYQLLVQRRPLVEARRELERVSGDDERAEQVDRFLDLHLDALAALLVEMGVLESVPPAIPSFARGPLPASSR